MLGNKLNTSYTIFVYIIIFLLQVFLLFYSTVVSVCKFDFVGRAIPMMVFFIGGSVFLAIVEIVKLKREKDYIEKIKYSLSVCMHFIFVVVFISLFIATTHRVWIISITMLITIVAIIGMFNLEAIAELIKPKKH